jgi:hypothetical protein
VKTCGRLPEVQVMGGRANDPLPSRSVKVRPKLRRVALNKDGFDNGGAFWGLPKNLYVVSWKWWSWRGVVGNLSIHPEDCRYFFRASSEDDAKRKIKELFNG